MNYAKIMENGTVRISSIKKDGYKPLKEEKPEGFSNLVFVGYTETEEFIIKEYEAVDDGMSAYGKLQKDLKATQAAQEVTGTYSCDNETGGVNYGAVFSKQNPRWSSDYRRSA